MGFPARYAGKCMRCQGEIAQGDMISWSRKPGQKGVYHMNCHKVVAGDESEVQLTEGEEKEMMGQSTGDVQDALKVLMAALQPKQDKPTIDMEEIKRIVRETITTEGTLKIEVKRQDAPEIKLDCAHYRVPQLIDLLNKRKHVYLYGPHGSGKSTAAHQAATGLNLSYGYISLTPQTPESRLIGFISATGNYIRTAFRDCYENGGVFCIDELDNSSPSLLTTLNGALENGHMAFPDTLVPRHADFVMVGTGNTSGKGANPSYPERRPFDAAFGDRFIYLQWNYDEKLERQIALAINPEAGKWVKWVQKARAWAEKNHPRFVPSPRSTFRLAELSLGSTFDTEELLDAIVWRGDSELASKVLANCPL